MVTLPTVPTDEGWLYLAALKDQYPCEIVGYAMGSRMSQDLVLTALRRALWQRRPGPGLIHHSDRGSQYCAKPYQSVLQAHGAQISMSRKGNYNNAPMESF